MAEDSVSDIVNSIKSEFPIFKDIQVRDRRDEGMSDNRQLEYYSEEDSPIEGVELVDIFNPKLQGEELKNAILGDMLHSAPSKSKKYADKKLQLINSRTPEQIEIDNRAYEIAIKQGEKRPFDKWYDVSRLDAFIRGYLVKQWDESYYTEEQKELMDSMLQTLKPKSGMSEGGSTSDQTEKAFRSNPLEGKQTVKRLKNVVRNAPVTGTLIDIADIGKSLLTGNYSQAAIDAGLALAGVTPVGKIASKGIQKTLKLFSKNKEDDPMGLVSDQIEKAPFTRAYGYTGRDSFVKTVLVPIEEAKKLFPNRRRFEAKDGSSSLGIDRIESLKSAIQSGKKLAPPFLTVNVPKKGSALLNSGHDGSHRISALEDLGHKYVPIDILF